MKRNLTVPERHQLRIARDTVKRPCAMARVLGGMDHLRAVNTIRNLTGSDIKLPDGCDCPR